MLALLAVSIVALTACGAFVMDVGIWMQSHRATQSVADAAALAGAQELPPFTSNATTVAQQYSDKNGGGVAQSPTECAENCLGAKVIKLVG